MNTYELTFLLPEEAETKSLKTILKSLEGNVLTEKEWGKRQLTYPIKKNSAALYFTWQIELDGKKLSEFKKKLNFNEELMRYLILKSESK